MAAYTFDLKIFVDSVDLDRRREAVHPQVSKRDYPEVYWRDGR